MMKKLLSACTCLAFVSIGYSAVVLSDTFSYGNGALTTLASSTWSTHSGTTPVLVTNGMIRISTSGSEDVNAGLAGAPYLESDAGAALFSSYSIIISNQAGLPTVAGGYMSHFRGTNTGAATDFGARVWLSATNATAGGTLAPGYYRVGVGNGTSVDAASGQIPTDLQTGVVYTVVTRFIPSTGTATIWLNPTAITDPSVTATDPGTVGRPNPFNVFTYAFRQGSGHGTSYIDDLRIGTTFNDVVGANTSPYLSTIPTQSGPANAAIGPIDFTVYDAETPAASLNLTTSSSNTGLVPNANVVLGGGGTNRTVTITPAAGQQGTTVITINANDGISSSFITFTVRIGFPTISAIDDQVTRTNTSTAAIAFTIGDAETPGALTVIGGSSNPTLVPDANVVISGSGTSRSVVVTPVANLGGQSLITLTVSDGINTSSETFTLTVAPHYGLLLGDEFTYSDGLVYDVSAGFWTRHSGASNDIFVANNQLTLAQTNTDDVSALFTNALEVTADSGAVLYSSFKATLSSLPRNNNGTYFAHFRDTGTSNFKGRVFAATNGAAASKFRFGIANGGNAPVMLPVDLDLNTTYNVVTRYNVGSAIATLWVNPANENSQSVTGNDIASNMSVWTYAFRQESINGTVGAVIAIDDLKVGSAFTDVATAAPDSIPLNIQKNGDGTVTLTWSNPVFKLQERASLTTGDWATLESATSGYTVSASGVKFYRLIAP